MAGIRVSSSSLQDENSSATAYRMSSSFKASLENAPAAPHLPASTRKLQPDANPPRRRALGDITNSVLRANAPSISQLCKPQAGPSSAVTAATAAAASSTSYTDEPERYAGKTWEQLEVEREQREDAAIAARVRSLLSGLALWPPLHVQAPADSSGDEEAGLAERPGAAAGAGAGPATLAAADAAPSNTDDSWLQPLPLEAASQLLPDVDLGTDWSMKAGAASSHELGAASGQQQPQEHGSTSSSGSGGSSMDLQEVVAASSPSSITGAVLTCPLMQVPEQQQQQQKGGDGTPAKSSAAAGNTASSPLLAQPW